MRRHALRWAAWIGGGVAVYALLGFLALPAILRPLLERDLSDALGRAVTIGHVATNPFVLSATLRDVSVADRTPGPPLLTFDELYANADIASLFRWAPMIRELRLTRPAMNVTRLGDNEYSVSDLIDRALAGPAGPPPRFSVSNIEVVDGRVTFDDRPAGRRHEVTQLALGIPFISSLPSQTEIRVEPAFSALVNGKAVAIHGETRPFKDTRETLLHLTLTDVALPTYVAYSPTPLPVRVESGVLGSTIDLRFVAHGAAPPELTLSGKAELRDLVVAERSGGKLLRVPALKLDLEELDVFGRRLDVRSVAMDGVELDVRRAAGGTLNLATLAASPAKPAKEPEEKPFAFRVKDLAIDHGTVRFADDAVAPAYATTLRDVAVRVADLASARGQDAAVDVSFVSDAGARVHHRGTFALVPLKAAGRLEVAGVKLAPLFPYYGSALNLVVDDGSLEAATDVRYEESNGTPNLTLANLDGKAVDLRMRLPDDKTPLWRVPVLAVHGGSVDVGRHVVHFDAIESRGGIANVRRDQDGTLNFARIVRSATPGGAGGASPISGASRPADAPPPPGAAEAATDAWHVDSASVSLEDYAANFDDATVSPTVRLALTHASLKVARLSNAAKATANVALRTTVNKGGALDVTGTFTPSPFALSARVAAKDIGVVPFQPYISRSAAVVVTDGRASARGDVTFASDPQTRAAFKGSVDLADVAVLDEANQADLLRWKGLALSAVDAQIEPLAVSIGDIALDHFYARLLLNENGEFNLQQLGRGRESAPAPAPATVVAGTRTQRAPAAPTAVAARTRPAAPASSATTQTTTATAASAAATGTTATTATTAIAPTDGAATTWLTLGKATLSDGELDFTDHFVRPNYSANVTGLAGSISSLAFDQPAEIALHGSVQGSAPVEIAGRINPLARNLFLDIKASATGIDMPPLSPYSGKYVGYGIEKGKLSMKVAYKVEERKLTAENTIILEQLTFGSKVDSPDAIKAPVRLAVALLKDRNGVIQFDLPVGGSIDDPQFSVGGLVFRALVNLVVKIVTAPFAILGSLGGHGADVSFIDFAPGSSTLDQTADGKVKALGKALKDRPGIKVDVTGYVDRDADADALKHAAVLRQVRAQKFNDLVKRGEPPASVDAVEVSADEYEPLLKRAYKAAKFDKPRNALGFVKDIPREEMEALLLANAAATDEDLRELAQHRAEAVRMALTTGEAVPADQVFLVAPRFDGKDANDARKPTRVEFALR